MTVLTEVPIVANIVSASGQVAFNINGLGNVGLFMTLTGVTGDQFAFEASIDSTDGVNGNWVAAPGMRSDLAAIESASGALSATPAYGWMFNVVCFNYFRVRATAGTFGTARVIATPGEKVPPAFIPASGTAGMIVQGSVATDSAVAGNPVQAGGRTTIVNAAARADGQVSPLTFDGQGRLLVKINAPNDLEWQVRAGPGAPITTATTTTLKAAIATFRQYITAIQLVNNSATGTEIALQDTTGTPVVIWRSFIGPNTIRDIQFPTPLRTGSGTASGISLVTVTTGCSIWWSMQGFIGY